MTDSNEPDPKEDEEFQRVLRNLVNTPHKPHVGPKAGTGEPAPDKVSGNKRSKSRD